MEDVAFHSPSPYEGECYFRTVGFEPLVHGSHSEVLDHWANAPRDEYIPSHGQIWIFGKSFLCQNFFPFRIKFIQIYIAPWYAMLFVVAFVEISVEETKHRKRAEKLLRLIIERTSHLKFSL
jgi:hypothetical protein